MSIDVAYCSFSPSRADVAWARADKELIEDLRIVRQYHAPHQKHQHDVTERQAAVRKTRELFGPRIKETYDWGEEDTKAFFSDFFASIEPVVKDMLATPDACFARACGGESNAEPPEAEELLVARARKHAEQLEGLIEPML
ncbi:MAG: hypothetical protein Q8Q18_02900 [bacterium]|nr:hypothetical protein [bacterium]